MWAWLDVFEFMDLRICVCSQTSDNLENLVYITVMKLVRLTFAKVKLD